jgi:acyl-CoA synthetase (AMP-forming)/AMP-acid ligase II
MSAFGAPQVLPGNAETFYGIVAAQAQKVPERDAVITSSRRLSYAALLGRVDGVRKRLKEAGVASAKDRVYLAELDKLDTLVGALATIGCGGVVVLAAHGGQDLLEECDPVAVLTKNPESYEDTKSAVVLTPGEEVVGSSTGDAAHCVDDANRPAVIMYTSGTSSGTRRGVVLSHRILAATTAYMNEIMGLNDTAREYVLSPLEHSFGFARCRAVLRAGGTIVFDEGIFNPARALLSVVHHDCNAISSVSSGFAILMRQFRGDLEKVGSRILWCEIGSVPLPVEMKGQMLQLMPRARIFMHYGLTEASRSTFLDLRKDQDKLDSVGRASPGVEVRVEEDGEIAIRGPNVALGYWRRPEDWRDRFRDGWLYTGDLGSMDVDGFVRIDGRKDDIINVGGHKVLPEPIEKALAPLMGERTYCVLGVEDPEHLLGDVPAVVVEGVVGPALRELQTFLRGRVPEHAIPRQVVSLHSLPRTPNGKIQRSLIRKSLASNRSRDESRS